MKKKRSAMRAEKMRRRPKSMQDVFSEVLKKHIELEYLRTTETTVERLSDGKIRVTMTLQEVKERLKRGEKI